MRRSFAGSVTGLLFSPRTAIVGVAAIIAALIMASAALAWSQEYVQSPAQFAPGQYSGSAYNSNIDYNTGTYSYNDPGDDMGLTLCNSGGSCYTPVYIASGGSDTRTISYGNAWCGGDYRNTGAIFPGYCITHN